MQASELTLGAAHVETIENNRDALEQRWPASVLASFDSSARDETGAVRIEVPGDHVGYIRDLFYLRAGKPLEYSERR